MPRLKLYAIKKTLWSRGRGVKGQNYDFFLKVAKLYIKLKGTKSKTICKQNDMHVLTLFGLNLVVSPMGTLKLWPS